MQATGIRLFPFIALPTFIGLLGLAAFFMGEDNLRLRAEWIGSASHKHLLPYFLAAILAISYPLGLLTNRFLQLLLKNRFLQRLYKPQQALIDPTAHVEILHSDSNGLITRAMENKYGILLFWRLSAVAVLFLGLGYLV